MNYRFRPFRLFFFFYWFAETHRVINSQGYHIFYRVSIIPNNTIKLHETFYNNYGWSSIISHQNTHEIDYLNPRNNRVSRHVWDQFSGPHFLQKKTKKRKRRRMRSSFPRDSFPTITDGIHDVTSESHMINRVPRCVLRLRLASVRRSSCSFFGAHTPCWESQMHRRGAALHANGIWAQRLCSRVHACTDAGLLRGI